MIRGGWSGFADEFGSDEGSEGVPGALYPHQSVRIVASEGLPVAKLACKLAESGRYWRQTASLKLKMPL